MKHHRNGLRSDKRSGETLVDWVVRTWPPAPPQRVPLSILMATISAAVSVSAFGQIERPPVELNFERPFISVVQAPEGWAESSRGAAGFDIIVNFSGGLTASQEAAFSAAEAAWEQRITGYQPGAQPPANELVIDASGTAIDGVGGVLGSAGPTVGWFTANFVVPTEGTMEFDTADLADLESAGTLGDVIEHEMGHVIGIGTLWQLNPQTGPPFHYVDGSGEYTGAGGVAEWTSEYGQAGDVDVELQGGVGTADGHWNENLGGAGTVGITDSHGRDMRDVLMTGWLNDNSFYSSLTHFSLPDIGYTIGTYSFIFADGFESGDTSLWQ